MIDAVDELEFATIEKVGLEQATVAGPWAWDIRLNQLSAGSFHSKLRVIRSADMMIHEQHWQRSVEVRGTTSEYCIMIGANLAWKRARLVWHGTSLDNRHFACAAPATEVDFKSPDRSHHIVLQVTPELLMSALGQESVDLLLGGKCLECKVVHGMKLITALTGFIRMYAIKASLLKHPLIFRAQKSHLFNVLGDCVSHSGRKTHADTGSSRKASVRNAIAYVESAGGPVTALELAMAADVSQRTLEYAFRDQLEITPAAYLRIHRLNAAHRELLSADPANSTVTEIAMRWGFNHPGRFSQIHRKLFEETPSDALRKSGR